MPRTQHCCCSKMAETGKVENIHFQSRKRQDNIAHKQMTTKLRRWAWYEL